jgi:hypothetical protein
MFLVITISIGMLKKNKAVFGLVRYARNGRALHNSLQRLDRPDFLLLHFGSLEPHT